MSTSSFAVQRPIPELLEVPNLSELYMIDINKNEKWYKVGMELGLETNVLEKIKVTCATPHLRKKAMFKEWLDIQRDKTSCTWQRVIEALRNVDPNIAESVTQTIVADSNQQSSISLRPHTAQFPLQKAGVGDRIESDVRVSSWSSAPPILSTADGREKRKQHHDTEIVNKKDEPHAYIEGELHFAHGRMEEDHAFRKSDVLEITHESEHVVRGSFSADTFASEEDSFVSFTSQHGDDDGALLPTSSVMVGDRDQSILEACKTNNLELIQLLIDRKELTPITRFKNERTLLMYAALQGSKVISAYVVKLEGFNSLLEVDKDGAMAIYFAVSEGYYEVVKVLVQAHTQQGIGLDLVVKGTPIIMIPASKGFSMICELLLENGANPNMINKDGETALHVAAFHGHKDVVKVLLRFNANFSVISKKTSMTPLEKAMESNHVETIKLLAEATFQAKKKNLELFTCKTREEIGRLVKAGAKVNVRHGDDTTPLMRHAQNGSLDLVLELIDCHADVDLQDETGESALMKASIGGFVKIVDVLIEHEAILDLKTVKGYTALSLSILNQHPEVVSRLLLAGADLKVKDKNGRTIEELATHTNNTEISEIIRRSRKMVKQEEPFIGVLSSYFQKKDIEAKSKREEREKYARRKELIGKMPQAPRSLEDGESTTQNELKKAYERISILETRVHDLSLQMTLEVPSEEDLAFLERNRLEAEFKKFKELKRKAEQYAIEAKQTSQRLSAENSKLREDLSKERRYNELTRGSIIHSIDKLVDDSVKLEEKTLAKMKVFEQEVASRLKQLSVSTSLATVGKFDFTPEKIKQFIFRDSLRMSLSLVVIGGLPGSGKSTLFRSMLNLKEELLQEQNVCQLPGLTVMEAAVMSNPYSSKQLQWLSSITKEDAELLMLAICLAQVCAKRSQSLSVLDTDEAGEVFESLFRSSSVNKYFARVFKRLQDLLAKHELEGSLHTLQHASVAFLNIWDIGVNKAVFEAMSLLARRCRNLVLLNVLSLKEDAMELNKGLNLQNFARYRGRYSARKDDERVMQVQKAYVYYSRFVEACNRLPNTTFLVGTHKDAYEGDKERVTEISSHVKHLVDEKVAATGFVEALHPQMIAVDARSDEDAKKVCKIMEDTILKSGTFEQSVPLTWIMLRGVLNAMDEMYLSKSEVWSYAGECGLQNMEDLESCLDLFQSCMSIIYSSDESIPSLHDNIVIRPYKFVECLDRLFYAEFNEKFRSNTKFKIHLNLMQKGILTYTFAKEIWPDDSISSSRRETQNVTCNFMLKVLQDLKMCTKVELTICFDSKTGGEERFPLNEKFYFIPSVRPYYSHSQPTQESNSLIIVATHVHQAPCDIYSEFVAFIQQQEMTKSLKLVACEHYDVVHLKWVENELPEVEISFKVLDFHDLVEVSVDIPKPPVGHQQSHEILALKQNVCSIMKTTCVEFFHKVSQTMSAMSYKVCIVSPSCDHTHKDDGIHVVPFGLRGDQNLDQLVCCTCEQQISLSSLPSTLRQRTMWITCAYQGSPHKIVSRRDTLTRHDLVNVADDLCFDSHSSEKVTELAVKLGIPEADIHTLKRMAASDDFPLVILLEWKKRQTVASRPQLAGALVSCGLKAIAMKLDSNVERKCPSPHPVIPRQSDPVLSAKQLSVITQSVPQAHWKELGEKLGLPEQDFQKLLRDKDKPDGKDSLMLVLQKWQRSKGNRDEVIHSLVGALTSIGQRSVADSIQLSDVDCEGIK